MSLMVNGKTLLGSTAAVLYGGWVARLANSSSLAKQAAKRELLTSRQPLSQPLEVATSHNIAAVIITDSIR